MNITYHTLIKQIITLTSCLRPSPFINLPIHVLLLVLCTIILTLGLWLFVPYVAVRKRGL